MKKIVSSYLILAMFVCSTSCKNGQSKTSGATGYNNSSAEAASNIIEYTNLIVDMSNKHNDYLEDVVQGTDKVEKALKNPNDRFAFISVMKPAYFPAFQSPTSKVSIDKPVKELGKADQQFFKDSVGKYQALFKTMQDNDDKLYDYIKAQDYKDDKGAKGFALIDTIRAQAVTLYTLKSTLMKKVEVVAEESEMIMLIDSPLKD